VPHNLRHFGIPAGDNPLKLTRDLALEVFDRAMEGRV